MCPPSPLDTRTQFTDCFSQAREGVGEGEFLLLLITGGGPQCDAPSKGSGKGGSS